MHRLPTFGISPRSFLLPLYSCITSSSWVSVKPNAWQSIHMIIFIATAESFFPQFHSTAATTQLHIIHINFHALPWWPSWICTHCILNCTLLFMKLFTLIGTGVRMGELCGKGSCIKRHLYRRSLCHQTYWPCLTHWGIMSSLSTSRLLAFCRRSWSDYCGVWTSMHKASFILSFSIYHRTYWPSLQEVSKLERDGNFVINLFFALKMSSLSQWPKMSTVFP